MAVGFREMCQWIAHNDDNNWLDDEDPIPSVTAVMVMHLFNKTQEQVSYEIQRQLNMAH